MTSLLEPTSLKWTCDGCGGSASRIDGEPTAQPVGWADCAEGRFCLVCRRARAGEAALDSAPEDSTHDERMRLRRTGLIEFEMLRAPDQLDRRIANACHTSAATVATVRRSLLAAEAEATQL
jgi:hypothetical protein